MIYYCIILYITQVFLSELNLLEVVVFLPTKSLCIICYNSFCIDCTHLVIAVYNAVSVHTVVTMGWWGSSQPVMRRQNISSYMYVHTHLAKCTISKNVNRKQFKLPVVHAK